MLSMCLSLLVAVITLAGIQAGCRVDCDLEDIAKCPGNGSFAEDTWGCHYYGCPCGTKPPHEETCRTELPGQSLCPTDCGPSPKDWITAINGCKSCTCTTDVGEEKVGTCPTNLSDRDFYLGRECEVGGDFACHGVQKCCRSNDGTINGQRCVDPEIICPVSRSINGRRCDRDMDCRSGEVCCQRFGLDYSLCLKGVLPRFPSYRYAGRIANATAASPTEWA